MANAVMGAVPLEEAGVASGTNSAFRELGGVFGVAVLASVFVHQGGYVTTTRFIDGFSAARWVGVGLSLLGIVAAMLAPRMSHAEAVVEPQPAPA